MRIWIALFLALALTGEGRALAAGLDDGIAAYRSGDYAKARELLGPLAEKGDYNAQFHMGEMTLKGLGGAASVDDAFGWYLKAATAGHAQAQANVGSMIALGLGEKRDMATAYYWLILSAIWTDTPLKGAGFSALGEVAGLLTPEEKRTLGDAAARVWKGGQ
jgi:TPR repeat protein